MNREKNIFLSVRLLGTFLLLSQVFAHRLNRERRSGISDQRLAELETLLALSKFKSFHTPVAYGLLDLEKIGKRKRSIEDAKEEEKKRFYPVDFRGEDTTPTKPRRKNSAPSERNEMRYDGRRR
ncbi:uncharacterized protein LOC111615419 [Centruroides sculpturatus]|uniref:uncharacterized protein LOC111615419 n=1 Tax=Centruroides sculpturatus TaxID=218467 RepID=UPI000C6D23F3|nr:uncharacterized protein LOC111615419 [Centruroides sculpturatus]